MNVNVNMNLLSQLAKTDMINTVLSIDSNKNKSYQYKYLTEVLKNGILLYSYNTDDDAAGVYLYRGRIHIYAPSGGSQFSSLSIITSPVKIDTAIYSSDEEGYKDHVFSISETASPLRSDGNCQVFFTEGDFVHHLPDTVYINSPAGMTEIEIYKE